MIADVPPEERRVARARGAGGGATVEQQQADMRLIAALHNAWPAVSAALREALVSPRVIVGTPSPMQFDADDTPPVEPPGRSPGCEKCGDEPTTEIRFPQVSEAWHPFCDRCAQGVEEDTREVVEHEMERFGGAYGVPTFDSRPLAVEPPGLVFVPCVPGSSLRALASDGAFYEVLPDISGMVDVECDGDFVLVRDTESEAIAAANRHNAARLARRGGPDAD